MWRDLWRCLRGKQRVVSCGEVGGQVEPGIAGAAVAWEVLVGAVRVGQVSLLVEEEGVADSLAVAFYCFDVRRRGLRRSSYFSERMSAASRL